jgi:hypothetical protein
LRSLGGHDADEAYEVVSVVGEDFVGMRVIGLDATEDVISGGQQMAGDGYLAVEVDLNVSRGLCVHGQIEDESERDGENECCDETEGINNRTNHDVTFLTFLFRASAHTGSWYTRRVHNVMVTEDWRR